MDYKAYFTPWAVQTNKFLDKLFAQKKKEAARLTPVAVKMWQQLETFIGGGKRIRGGLVKLGYESVGGKNSKNVLPVSAAIEITHASILVHDDIIDQDTLRHGRPTVHSSYEAHHKSNYKKGNSSHYGESMATCVGITGCYEGIRLVSSSNFPENLKNHAANFMCNFLITTGYGEALDVDVAYQERITEKDVTTINTLKTAWYTIIGPLSLGAILAGASPRDLKAIEKYGLPLGIAFQLQDDILGVFGSEEKTGKSAASDIKEGKNTLLYVQALKRSNPTQKRLLLKLWGNRKITPKQTEQVRQILVDTGALAHCQKLAQKLAKQAKDAVPAITKDKNLQGVYLTLADFIVQREH